MAGAEQLDAEDLVVLGVASRQAARHADAIRRGVTLVVVACDERRLARLRDLMAHHGLRAAAEVPPSGHLHFAQRSPDELASREPIDEGGARGDETIRDNYRRADSERWSGQRDTGSAGGLSRRAHGSAPSPSPRDSSAEGPYSPTGTSQRLDRFERQFSRHYDEHFADSGLPWGLVARAYHYGVVLARHPGFRDRHWASVAGVARQGWTTQVHGDWQAVRGAVHYGWSLARRGKGREPMRP